MSQDRTLARRRIPRPASFTGVVLLVSLLALASSRFRVSAEDAAKAPAEDTVQAPAGDAVQASADPYTEVLGAQPGRPRSAMAAIETEIRRATPEALRAIESRLLDLLSHPGASGECKEWVCRQLRQVGSDRSLPILGELLADEDLHTVARLALQSIPGPATDRVLRESLSRLQGELKAGAILTIGARGDRQAVGILAPLANDPDERIAEAALYALGRAGGDEALQALRAAVVPEGLRRYRFEALLLCAEGFAAESRKAEAARLYESVRAESQDGIVRVAALRGQVLSGGRDATAALPSALRDSDASLRAAAVKFLRELCDAGQVQTVFSSLRNFSSDTQVLLLGAIDDTAILTAAIDAAKGDDEAVRLAALGALGRVGDASAVGLLIDVASQESGSGSAAGVARESLLQLRSEDVEAALIERARTGSVAARVEAMRALSGRRASTGVETLLAATEDADPRVQEEALRALGNLADLKALPRLVELLIDAKTDARRAAVEAAASAVCRRIDEKDAASAALISAQAGAAPDARQALLRMLANAACPRARGALLEALDDPDAKVGDCALAVLAEWPDATVLPDLLAAARSSARDDARSTALRGMAKLARIPGGPAGEERVRCLGDALVVARRIDDRKALLSALSKVQHPSALEVALGLLADEALEVDAAVAVLEISKELRKADPDRAAAAVERILQVCKSTTARQLAESSSFVPSGMINLVPQGTCTSPDDIEKDGEASGDQAAIDGDPATYWDEEDGRPLYRLVVTFPQPKKFTLISIMGWAHEQYAPRDFEILADGVVVKKVEGARYDSNFLVIPFAPVNATRMELKITGYYGGSPAIRELGIYRKVAGK